MADLNNITVTGHLTKDAELKSFPSGSVFLNFDVANNTGFGDYAKTTYFRVKMLGKNAEKVKQFLKKGQLVGVSGELTENSWTKQDGTVVKNLEITTMNVTLLGGGKKNEQSEQQFNRDELEAKLAMMKNEKRTEVF